MLCNLSARKQNGLVRSPCRRTLYTIGIRCCESLLEHASTSGTAMVSTTGPRSLELDGAADLDATKRSSMPSGSSDTSPSPSLAALMCTQQQAPHGLPHGLPALAAPTPARQPAARPRAARRRWRPCASSSSSAAGVTPRHIGLLGAS